MTANGCQPNQYCHGTEAKAAIQFSINPSIIPSGNWLEGTINLQGEDTTYGGINYAVRAAVVLYPNGQFGLVSDFWQDCEGLTNNNKLCTGPLGWAHELWAGILLINGLPSNKLIYVMIDASTSGQVKWSYSYDGSTWMQYASYAPPSTSKSALYLGTVNIISAPYFTAYYYQFGVWAQNTFKGPFSVTFNSPSYFMNEAWTSIPTAYSIHGGATYYDENWEYSSVAWNNILVTHPNSTPSATFSYSATGSTGDNVCLWGC